MQYPTKFETGMPFIYFTSWLYNLPGPKIPFLDKNDRTRGIYPEIALYVPGDFTETANATWSPEGVFQGTAPGMLGWAATNLADALGKSGGGQKVLSSAQGGFGECPFPSDVNIFKEISPLGFTLNWNMIPFDASEAREIEKICWTFKNSMVPHMDAGLKNGLLKFPNIWDCKFVGIKGIGYKDSTYQNMAITNCSVAYKSGNESASVYEDGNPTQIQLSVTFQAIKKFFL